MGSRGGGAEYVLIGGPVKQFGEHILTGLRLISLEPALREHLSGTIRKESSSSGRTCLITAQPSIWLNNNEVSLLMSAHLLTPVSCSLFTFHPNCFVVSRTSVSAHSLSGQ